MSFLDFLKILRLNFYYYDFFFENMINRFNFFHIYCFFSSLLVVNFRKFIKNRNVKALNLRGNRNIKRLKLIDIEIVTLRAFNLSIFCEIFEASWIVRVLRDMVIFITLGIHLTHLIRF